MNIKTLGNKIKGNPSVAGGTVFSILIIIGIGHFLNDMIQSVVPSIYPILKDKFGFSFAQIGIITFVFQISSSICNRSQASMPTVIRALTRCLWACASRWSVCSFLLSPQAMPSSFCLSL